MTAARRRSLPVLCLAMGSMGLLIVPQLAGATHVRPAGATPFRASFVTAYKPCAAPNRSHGAPLSFPSCGAPAQASSFLTVGTHDANGADAQSIGYILVRVKTTSPEDVLITSSISDVRCKPGTNASVCNSPNAADGPDYSGQLQSNATLRLSDHYNGPNLDEAATVQDIPFPVSYFCSNTSDTSTGGFCTINTTVSAQIPPYSFDGKRSVVGLGQFEVSDGGADGNVGTADNTAFLRQGVFVP